VIDTQMTPGYTFDSVEPTKRLDYLLISSNQTVMDVDIPASNASDHLGIAATIIQN
jgi:endonuclease/exonuclease/phosphatase family metal-dependent hydrolase